MRERRDRPVLAITGVTGALARGWFCSQCRSNILREGTAHMTATAQPLHNQKHSFV